MNKINVLKVLKNDLKFSDSSINKLDIFHSLLLAYNKSYNLISKSTESEIWTRHILDSAQIVNLINSHDFKLVGISVSNSDNIDDCIETAKYIKSSILKTIPMVIGGQGVAKGTNKKLYSFFDDITLSPAEALELIERKK